MKHATQYRNVPHAFSLPHRLWHKGSYASHSAGMGRGIIRLYRRPHHESRRPFTRNKRHFRPYSSASTPRCSARIRRRYARVEASSSRWVRKNHNAKFSWQRRYGAFTVSESASNAVRKYIRAQKEHHSKQSFLDEYKGLLLKHGVAFDERYLWD